ncbi:hypothetical protein NQ317_007483 [Molorchus minor]|uniref:Uncharacterized protein n=1 Tax=Molorchus minor TaxID=1323400 RepID=A0ABQ9K2E2_9CUCU|nr:hypothetical protein NQ317_007483 [Molorchus minor]
MIHIFILLLTIICVNANAISRQNLEEEWSDFKMNHGKNYQSFEEEQIRKTIFSENLYKIREHNQLYAEGMATYTMTINKFADLTREERDRKHKGLKRDDRDQKDTQGLNFVPDPQTDVPKEFDWRQKGAVTKVKDQGACGSCWAFSSVGAVESQYFLKTGKLVNISEQNLVDCSKDGNEGCYGGFPTSAFYYIHTNNGIDSDEAYPYTAEDGVCKYKESSNVTTIKFFGHVEYGNEEYLAAAIASVGPISVEIYADDSFEFYDSGCIITDVAKRIMPITQS